MPKFLAPSALPVIATGLVFAVSGMGTARAAEEGKQCSIAPINGCNLAYYCRIQAPVTPAKLGYCTRKPDTCPAVQQPVCGVNGQTYANACLASKDGENVEHEGPCPK